MRGRGEQPAVDFEDDAMNRSGTGPAPIPPHLNPTRDALAAATIPLSRRSMLRAGFLAAASAALTPACAPLSGGAGVSPRRHVRPLAPVRVSADRLIRTTAGLRPFRAPGFVVRADRYDDKTVIHNYGHGGGGISLSWGSSALAVELAAETGVTRFAVLGSGIMGLTTGRLLQDRGFDVTIYAKDLPPFTTSNMSGGQWSPASVADFSRAPEGFMEQFERASRFAHRYYQNLVGAKYGVRWIENYALGDAPPPAGSNIRGPISDLFPATEVFGPGEHPFGSPYARRFVTMLIEPAVFLNTVSDDFLLRGGNIEVREFRDVGEVLALEEVAVVNCTGLGSQALFGDEELIPVKGQLAVLIPQEEIDYISLAGGMYMFPRSDGIVLGGTHERGVWSLENDPSAIERILEVNAAVLPRG